MPKKAGMEKWKKKRRQEYLEMKQYRYYNFLKDTKTKARCIHRGLRLREIQHRV